MPSKINAVISPITASLNILKDKINTLTNSVNILKEDQNTLHSKIDAKKTIKQRTYGLTDLIAGKTPTLTDWTINPTDAENITDDNIATFCTTGSKILGAGWQNAIFEWDLGNIEHILVGGVMKSTATAGTPYINLNVYNGAGWIACRTSMSISSLVGSVAWVGMGSKIRLCVTASAAGTITPNIRELYVLKIK